MTLPVLRIAMRRLPALGLLLLIAAGCIGQPPTYPAYPGGPVGSSLYQNPVFLPMADPEQAWETVADVADDYFPLSAEREKPTRRIGDVITEGELDTLPAVGSTYFEPWRHDSASPYEKALATLQTIRRRAVFRVVPAQGGYWVEVSVFKELEDLPQPQQASAGVSTFRNDGTLTRVVNPVGVLEVAPNWIPQGRDTALEQRIIAQLLSRAGAPR